MKDITKKYTNGEVTIIWKPAACIHSTICWKEATGLPHVFDPRVKPWIRPDADTTEHMIAQVKKCPSGALSYIMNSDEPRMAEVEAESIIEVMPDGPLLVYGNITIKDKDGSEIRKNNVTAFCRCGQSGNKPYCDGTHKKVGFIG